MIALIGIVILAWVIYRLTRDTSQPHNYYFQRLNQTLQQVGPARPLQLVDMDRLAGNAAVVKRHYPYPKQLRFVVKSLPCVPLLKWLLETFRNDKLMVFDWHFLPKLLPQFPGVDFLFGKPMPVQALRQAIEQIQDCSPNSLTQVQWLVDSPQRLMQYLSVAEEKSVTLRISIEIDVGMHRGGVSDLASYRQVLSTIQQYSAYLQLSGLMGYDAHVAKVPHLWPMSAEGVMAKAHQKMLTQYRQYVHVLQVEYASLFHSALCFNSGGSPTYCLHGGNQVVNDVSLGSCLLQPTDFDLPHLAAHQPAWFIATPVLKKMAGLQIPFVELLSNFIARYLPRWQHTYFIYGGYWRAEPFSPQGLYFNPLYGRSSNQEILTGSAKTALEIDDYIFFRPSQSEAVMLEFPEVYVVRDGRVVEQWAMLK
ncbi:alanine racemase [Spartinivicinus ruber]|uniref:alanine racemase n=1 Tax=Spartinivicinus ruber TaxID=2683272 RepID=UPI0013D63CAD|nr:alanine racemase [Spartinivicinus ruber]